MSLLQKQKELEDAPDSFLQQLLQQGNPQYPGWLVAAVADQRADFRQRYQNQQAMAQAEQPTMVQNVSAKLGGIPDVDPNQMGDPSLATGIAGGMAAAGGGVIPKYQTSGLVGDDDDDPDLPRLREIPREFFTQVADSRAMGAYLPASTPDLDKLRDFVEEEYDLSLERPGGRKDVSPVERERGIQDLTDRYLAGLNLSGIEAVDLRGEMFERRKATGAEAEAEMEDYVPRQGRLYIDEGDVGSETMDLLRRREDPDYRVPQSTAQILADEILAAEAAGDEEAAERAFNDLMRSQGYGPRAGGVDGRGGSGPTRAGLYAKMGQELQEFEDLMRTKSDEDVALERIQRDIAQKKYEQARGIGTLDRGRLAQMENMLDRRLGMGRDRIADLERLEATRKAGEELGFESAFMGDIADALRGDIKFSDVSRGARTFGEEMTAQEKEALQAIYEEETSLLETEDTALGNQYNLRRSIQTESDEAELILDNLNEQIARADADRGRAGASELLDGWLSLWTSQAEELGLDSRAAQELEGLMRTAKISADNQALDSSQWENIQNRFNDARTTFAGDEDMLAKIAQAEQFVQTVWLRSSYDEAAGATTADGATTRTIDRNVYSRAGVAGLSPRSNLDSSGMPLPPIS